MGIAMGSTAIGIIYSFCGERSGAYLNPSVTLTFLSLGRICGWEALFYIVAQFAGATLGVTIAGRRLLGGMLRHVAVNYAITMPGRDGTAAFWAEVAISGCPWRQSCSFPRAKGSHGARASSPAL